MDFEAECSCGATYFCHEVARPGAGDRAGPLCGLREARAWMAGSIRKSHTNTPAARAQQKGREYHARFAAFRVPTHERGLNEESTCGSQRGSPAIALW